MNWAEVKSSEGFLGSYIGPARNRGEMNPTVRAWRTAKRITLVVLLAGSFILYYVIDKMNQAYSAF